MVSIIVVTSHVVIVVRIIYSDPVTCSSSHSRCGQYKCKGSIVVAKHMRAGMGAGSVGSEWVTYQV